MSKRLQVLLSDHEYARVKRISKSQKKTVGAWVREVLRKEVPTSGEPVTEKLKVIERSAKYSFPVADLPLMLSEIETGYSEGFYFDSDRLEHSDVPDRKRPSAKK